MTEHEIIRIRKLLKRMKFRHPFKWRRYTNHVSIVMYLMDSLDDLDKMVRKEEFPVLHMSEDQSVEIIKQSGQILQAINLWKQSPLFHSYLNSRVEECTKQTLDAVYEYVQTMLNLSIADMNKILIDYINALKDEILSRSREEFDECDIDESDIDIQIQDMSSDMEAKSTQFTTILRLRNEASARRIVARNYIGTLRSVLYYDYIDIIRGVDIISKIKYENKSISKSLRKSTIKFVDIESIKEDKQK